ncbi:DnaJ domain-containing protein [Mycena maculata]|uniref:DnaJ domain-containing protein n=1 Tax=Mycena maculata TaxID=230809 RepID=A0AAD7MWC2_9AGAR|nr:DnaJ domain-containing protein [Mycena maculata]
MGNSESNRKQPKDGGPRRRRPRRPRATARDPCPSAYFYQVLGIEQTATSSEIRGSYLKKVVEAHPDKNLDDPDGAAKRFRVVQQAYDVLSDNDKRAEYDHAPRDFHLEIADCLEGGDDLEYETNDGEDSDDYDDAYSDDEPDYEPAPRFWFNPWGTEHAPKKQAYESPTGVVDIKEMVEFFDSLTGLPWSDRAPNSTYTRISTFYARLAADDERFRLGHAPAAAPPAFGGASGVFQRGVYRDEERVRLDLSSPDVQKFYSYWMGFRCTRGRYAWVEPYYCGCRMQGCPSARANRRVQEGMRDAFAEVVRLLTTMLRELDPRYQEYLERKKDGTAYSAAIEKKLNEERQRQKAKKKEKKRRSKGKW